MRLLLLMGFQLGFYRSLELISEKEAKRIEE